MGKKINELTEITEVPSSSYILVDDGTLNNKVTKENLMKDYLPLTGGTLTGRVTFNSEVFIKNGQYIKTNIFEDDSYVPILGTEEDNCVVGDQEFNLQLRSYENPSIKLPEGSSYKIYHEGNKPTAADIGAAAASHSHNYLSTSGGTVSGDVTANTVIAEKFKTFSNNTISAKGGSAFGSSHTYGGNAIAGGSNVTAGGDYSAAFGESTNLVTSALSSYTASTGIGDLITAWESKNFSCAQGKGSFVCGKDNLAIESYQHITGYQNYGYGTYGHMEGRTNKVTETANCIHVEGGYNTVKGGNYSHMEGYYNQSSGGYCHTGGYYSIGKSCQYAFGHYNKETAGHNTSNTNSYSALVIGNGTSTARSNCFRVDYSGGVIGLKSFASSGADYAEYFEWQDGNVNKEDRRGYFVTLDEDKIRIAKPGEYILGIVSGNPAVIGNNDMQWKGHYLFDEFGCHIIERKTIINDEGEEEEIEMLAINPELDTEREYIHRSERPEWDTIGMLGVLIVRDDGTCKVNGFCECNENGIATASETGYRVIKRVNDHIVKVLFR